MAKLIVLIALVAHFVAANAAPEVGPSPRAGSRNLIICPDGIAESKLEYSYRFTKGPLLFHTRRETMVYPASGLTTTKITCLRVIDKVTNNNGGYVELAGGNVGQNSLILDFESQWSKGWDFLIEIYVAVA